MKMKGRELEAGPGACPLELNALGNCRSPQRCIASCAVRGSSNFHATAAESIVSLWIAATRMLPELIGMAVTLFDEHVCVIWLATENTMLPRKQRQKRPQGQRICTVVYQ
jgi:hypothetical protein